MISRRRQRSSSASRPKPRSCSPAGAIPSQRPPEARGRETMWPDRRLIELFKTEFPIVQAPMAGVMDAELVIAAAQGGALGSLPCAMLSVDKIREQVGVIRQRVKA